MCGEERVLVEDARQGRKVDGLCFMSFHDLYLKQPRIGSFRDLLTQTSKPFISIVVLVPDTG